MNEGKKAVTGELVARVEATTTGRPWIVETRPDDKYPDITLAQIIAPRGYVDDIGNVSRCAVTDWLDSPADARLIVRSVNNAEKLAEALRELADQCQLARKYIVLDDDNGLAAYHATATAWNDARAALARYSQN